MIRSPFWSSWQASALCGLLLIDIGWRAWSWAHPHAICATPTSIAGTPLMLQAYHEGNVDAVALHNGESKQWSTVWAQEDTNGDGKADVARYYFEGRNILNVNLRSNTPPQFDFYLAVQETSTIWRLDPAGKWVSAK